MTEPSARPSRTSLLPAIDPEKFEQLERSFIEAGDPVKLGRLFLSFAAQKSDTREAVARLRRGIAALGQVADSQEQVSWLLHELVRLDPADEDAFDAVRTYYESTEKHRELVRLIEDLFERSDGITSTRERELRRALFDLYRDKLDDKAKAAQQVGLLIARDDADEAWLDEAEELLKSRGLIIHLGAPLSAAYRRLGKASQELSVLTRELEVARGGRLTDVQSRLAALRHDFLDDVDGAMELLEPLVSRDPSHDEARERYLTICATQGRLADAARRITRALDAVVEPSARVRVGLDLARVLLRLDDKDLAKAELVRALEADSTTRATLEAAHLLTHSFDELTPVERVLCQSAIAANETDPARRYQAATALLELDGAQGVELSPERKKTAYLALLDSDQAASILGELARLCESTGDDLALSRVFERRAELAESPEQAAEFAYRAAELFEKTTADDARSVANWKRYVERFPAEARGVERLMDLLESSGRVAELVGLLTGSTQGLQPSDAARFWARAGEVELTKLSDVDSALKSLERALGFDAKQPMAIAALEDLMARGAKRLEAASTLEAVARRSSNDALLVDVLAVKAELLSDADARKAADIEVFELLRDKLDDPQRALALAARVLKDATSRDPAALLPWLERIRNVETPDALFSLRARVLSSALGDREIDTPELFALAREAGMALTQAGNFDAASAVYEKALQYDPSAADLALGLDALRARQGVAGAQRIAYLELSLIDVEGNLSGWCRVMGAIANIHRNELGDPEAAAQAYKDVLDRAPEDRETHRALVQIYQDMSDQEALGAELERAISVFSGADKLHAEFALAMLRADAGDPGKAVELCNKLLDTGSLSFEQLDSIADLAEQQGDSQLFRRVQERRIEDATDPLSRAQELERLGVLLSEQLDDKEAAADAFKRAAEASLGVPGEEEYAKTLFERVLDVRPEDQATAEQFVRFCLDAGDWDRIVTGINALIALDASRAGTFVLELAARARSDGAAMRFVSVADDVLEVVGGDPELRHRLLLAKAEVLASDRGQRSEASQAFRAVIEAFADKEDEALFDGFIRRCPLDDERTDDQRWLFEKRVQSAENPVPVLLEWARLEEEEFADPEAAIGVYDRLIEFRPTERTALERAARLKLQCGAHEGALEVLRQLRKVSPPEQQASIQLRIASLLIGDLNRPEQGYQELARLLGDHPSDPLALELGFEGLDTPGARSLAARALAPSLEVEEQREALLERLLEALAEADELVEERKAWFEQLIELKSGAEALKLSCAAASQLPDTLSLWDRAEQMAQKLELPEPVAQAYEKALARELPPELVATLGRRMLEFHEQWFGDSAVLLPALLNLLKQTPHARWALDRAVLALNGQGRFEEVYGLFDAAITYAPEGPERISLLDEAALTAKDLANDPERAIAYLEQLVELKPEDARAQSTLERLYKRCGHTRKLIDLLSKRLADLSGSDLIAMLDQIACRWLELDQPDEALSCVRKMLGLEPENERACQILERVLGAEDFAESESWDDDDKSSSELLDTREQAAELLKATYQRIGRLADVVRVAERELAFLDDSARRGQVLREIVAARLGNLNDKQGAFDSLSKLVVLEPTASEPRIQLKQLSDELGQPKRYAELLVRAAENSTVECELFQEAAQVYTKELDDPARETELYERVLQLAPDDETVLMAARALDRLLSRTEDVDHHCEVLERLAGVETDDKARRNALVRAARIASDPLADWERSAKNWRDVLSFAPEDREALDGLVAVLLAAKQWADLIGVLEVRAGLLKGNDARADHILIARTLADHLGDPARAIERWQLVRERFGPDDENFEALARLLEAEQRWEAFAELLAIEAANADGERRAYLLIRLAAVRRDHLGDFSGALDAFVAAREWRDAVSIIEAADTPERAAELTDSLRVIAIERWHAGDELAEDAAYWAIKSRAQQLLDLAEDGKQTKDRSARKGSSPPERAFALLEESIQLPFGVARRRSLERSAALVSSDATHEPEKALAIFARMFDEDVTDAAASKSVTKYSELLESAGRHVERAQLWERIARALGRIGDEVGACSYWEHAGQLWEQLEEAPLAILAYRRAADLGSVASLEALTRLHLAAGEKYEALDALERIFALSSGDALVACTNRLLDLALELGERHRARVHLEAAVDRVPANLSLHERLATLYREEQVSKPFAKLLTAQAALVTDPEERATLLREAAKVTRDKLSDPARALALLEQAAALFPEERAFRLTVADAQSAAGLHEQAIAALQAEVESFGVRRPKTRARAHRKLAHALATAGRHAEALKELETAAEINSTDAGLLFEYATAALAAGELERAEQTFRASLLVLHRPSPDAAPPVSRADVYLSLSEVAAEKGERLAMKDFVESAFETALEGRAEAFELEKVFKKRGKDDLLKRALETRLTRSSSLEDKVGALAELTGVYTRLDEKDARRDSVAGAAERLGKGVSETDAPNIWRDLARVYAWLEDTDREIDALEAYLQALPVEQLRASHAAPSYRVCQARMAMNSDPDSVLALLRRAIALDPAPEKRDALLAHALEVYPTHAGFARAFVAAAKASGRENQLAEALAHLAELPDATLEEGRKAVHQCLAVGNSALMEKATGALLMRGDLDVETRYYLQSQLAEHYQATNRISEAFDLKLELAEEAEAPERTRVLREAAELCESRLDDDSRRARVYRLLFDEHPTDRAVWEPLFGAYLRLEAHSELKQIIEQTLPRVRGADRGALRLAQARLLLADESEVDAAVATLEKALDEDPNQREAAELLAETLERLGRLNELVGVFEGQLAQARANQDTQAFESLTLRVGALLERADRPEDAVQAYQALLSEKPQHLQALRALVNLADQVEIDDKVPVMRRLLARVSGEEAARVSLKLFESAKAKDDLPLGLEVLEEGFEKCPGDEKLRRHLVEAYTHSYDVEAAAGVLSRAVEALPSDGELLKEAVDAWLSADQPERALALLDRRLEQRPGDEALHFRRAQVLEVMDRHEEALAALQRAHDEGGNYVDELISALDSLSQKKGRPESDMLILRLADLLEQRGSDEAAREHLRALLRDSPDNAEALSRLAALSEKHGDTSDAIQAYRGLLRLEAGDDLVPTVFKLIDACEKLDRLTEVLDDLERARERLPDHERLRDRIRGVYEKSGETNRLAEVLIDDAARRDNPQAKAQLLTQAARLVIDDDPTSAQMLLEQAEQAHSSLESGLLLARLRAMRGQREDALVELAKLAAPQESRKPVERVAAFWELAQLHLLEDEIKEAYDVLLQAHKLERRNGEVALTLGMLALDLDDEKTAGRALRSVTAMKARTSTSQGAGPDEKSKAYYLLSHVARRKGDTNGARRMAQKAVGEDPSNKDAEALLEALG